MKINEVDTVAGLNKAFQLMKDRQSQNDTHSQSLKDIQEVHGDEYVAAVLYLNNKGRTKLALARKLSEVTGVDSPTAMRMIDAIDAYEDIKGAEEFKHVQEGEKSESDSSSWHQKSGGKNSCDTCGAKAGSRCVTATGREARRQCRGRA